MNGVFAVYKPRGLLSTKATDAIKRILKKDCRPLRVPKVGHGGTLDADAEGILVIGVGQGTKAMTFFLNGSKEYEVTGFLGKETHSYEFVGDTVSEIDTSELSIAERVSKEDIIKQLEKYQDSQIKQTPPPYSALKLKGSRLSDLQHSGRLSPEDLEKKARYVRSYKAELIDYSPPHFKVRVSCGAGFYVRSMVHDIGQGLGVGACTTFLLRSKQGRFELGGEFPILERDDWTADNIREAIDETISLSRGIGSKVDSK